jgi:hypothetical protein
LTGLSGFSTKPRIIWSSNRTTRGDDAELEEDDPAEDDGLREPSLGSVGDTHFNQERWAAGGRRDLEQDDAESGIADQDGLDEQVPFRDWMMVGMV